MKRYGPIAAAMSLGLAVLAGVPTIAADVPPQAHANPYTSNGAARDRGVVRGSVASVDYARGSIVVTSSRGRVRITVLPTTGIFQKSKGYASLSDIHPGTRVEVSVSEVGGQLIAQIIRIK